jgi:hypothetical protein
LKAVLASGAVVAVETGKFLVPLNKAACKEFHDKELELAASIGLTRIKCKNHIPHSE